MHEFVSAQKSQITKGYCDEDMYLSHFSGHFNMIGDMTRERKACEVTFQTGEYL